MCFLLIYACCVWFCFFSFLEIGIGCEKQELFPRNLRLPCFIVGAVPLSKTKKAASFMLNQRCVVFCFVMLCFVLEKFRLVESRVPEVHTWRDFRDHRQPCVSGVLLSKNVVADYGCSKFCKQIKELKGAIGPLSGHGLVYCTDACLKRYLEARNWNVDKSKKMLGETLKWRSTYKPEEIRWVSSGLASTFQISVESNIG